MRGEHLNTQPRAIPSEGPLAELTCFALAYLEEVMMDCGAKGGDRRQKGVTPPPHQCVAVKRQVSALPLPGPVMVPAFLVFLTEMDS